MKIEATLSVSLRSSTVRVQVYRVLTIKKQSMTSNIGAHLWLLSTQQSNVEGRHVLGACSLYATGCEVLYVIRTLKSPKRSKPLRRKGPKHMDLRRLHCTVLPRGATKPRRTTDEGATIDGRQRLHACAREDKSHISLITVLIDDTCGRM